MSEDFGSDFITIIDDEGNEFELEHLDTIEHGDEVYMAFLPADLDEDDEDYGMVILKVVGEDGGEDMLASINDESELDDVYERFMLRQMDNEED